MTRLAFLLAVALSTIFCTAARAEGPGAVVQWNRIALHTTAQAPFDPPRETRSIAIVQAAVLDAATSITHAREPYLVRVAAPRRASVAAAVAGAAHRSLAALYPDQHGVLDDD
jgi:hypothetical protein